MNTFPSVLISWGNAPPSHGFLSSYLSYLSCGDQISHLVHFLTSELKTAPKPTMFTTRRHQHLGLIKQTAGLFTVSHMPKQQAADFRSWKRPDPSQCGVLWVFMSVHVCARERLRDKIREKSTMCVRACVCRNVHACIFMH